MSGRQASVRRYAPLVLVLLGAGAAVAVWHGIHTRDDAAVAATTDGPSLPAVCAPAVDQGITVEPWRGRTRATASEATFARRTEGENAGYVDGRDGWKFFSDIQADELSQAVGRKRLTKTPIKRWDDYFSQMQHEAEARGGKFYILIAPAKWDVYPEKLPQWAQELRGTNSLDSLMSAHPELPFIDVRHPLREAGRTEPTYSPLNSHWTDYGAYVAWQAATACLRADGADDVVDVPAITSVLRNPDLNELEADGVKASGELQWTIPSYAQPHADTTVTDLEDGRRVTVGADDTIDAQLLPVETRTPEAQSAKTLLVLRDSTGTALAPVLTTSFARTVQYPHPVGGFREAVDMSRLVSTYRPDITIFTMTERYLGFGPPGAAATP